MTRRRKESQVTPPVAGEKAAVVRCAIYTRKSTDEGLDRDFSSLDAQRESGEAYIASQKHEGWMCLPERYDDGGFSGGNMERPALRRLLTAAKAGKVDTIVVYKVDRLSRSLLDFARIMEVLEQYSVSFVSVTQQFHTASSMGRLMLNILFSFAQFERETIAERTQDKMSAARRKGKWVGGIPLLGYDIVPEGGKIVVNDREAEQVRQIFETYAKEQSLSRTLRRIEQAGIRAKRWVTRKGVERGGKPFSKAILADLLANRTYIGEVFYQGEVNPGEHDAIVDESLWKQVQEILASNRRRGGARVRNRYGALLRGLLTCVPCNTSMTLSCTGKGSRRYRYYVCSAAQKRGWRACPRPSVPAGEIEQFVVERIRAIGSDEGIVEETLRQAGDLSADRSVALETGLRSALDRFDPIWEAMSLQEQARLLDLLVEQVGYDGAAGRVLVTFRPGSIPVLARGQS